jgi:transposase
MDHKKLQAKWEKRLASEGLASLDESDGSGGIRLKDQRRSSRLRQMDPEAYSARAEYFRRAEAALLTMGWDEVWHETAWLLHAVEGMYPRAIAKRVKKDEHLVERILAEYRIRAGLRKR